MWSHQSSETVLQKALGEDQATTKLVAIARDLGTGARPRESEDDDDGNLFKCVFVCERTTQEMSTVAAPKCALVQSATKVCRPSQRRPAGLPSSKSFLPLASPRTSPRTHRRDESRFLTTTSSRIRTHVRISFARSPQSRGRRRGTGSRPRQHRPSSTSLRRPLTPSSPRLPRPWTRRRRW